MEFTASHSFASFAATTDSNLGAARLFSDCMRWLVRNAVMSSSSRKRRQFWMTTQPNKPPEPAAVGACTSACRGSRHESTVAQVFSSGSITHHTMKLLFVACLAVVVITGCKKEDPANSVLPGRRMSEAQVLSQATTVFRPGPDCSQFHVSFTNGVWQVSCESNHIPKALTIQDADGKMEITKP